MHVDIKRIDTTLPLPAYHTAGAAAFDISSRDTQTIAPHSLARLPTNLIIQTPPGYMLVVVPRSGLPAKKGLIIPHGIGIVDQDYCGDADEILFQVYNITDTPVTVDRGERIGQGVFIPIERAEWHEVPSMAAPDRGGFGSTG